MKEFFKDLLEYTHQYNQELTDVFEKEISSDKSQLLFSHILNAQHIWNSRILSNTPKYKVWDMHEIKLFNSILTSNYNTSLNILEEFELRQMIKYSNSSGQIFENQVKDILFQIINHSTYHRAQIATEFKNLGIKPILSDYIFYKR